MMRKVTERVKQRAGGALIVSLTIITLSFAKSAGAQTCSGDENCNSLVEAAEILQPRVGVGLSGGNPVAGASSTLGMRIGSIPRITFAVRVNGVRAHLPPTHPSQPVGDNRNTLTSINFDAAVGVFSGIGLLPTVGGFGSIDAVASAGTIRLPNGAGFNTDPSSWAVGARLGLLRESFTAPGVSITGMYRRIGDVKWADADAFGPGASFTMADNSVWSVRGVVGKRLFVLGAAAGIGFDKYSSDVTAEVNCATLCIAVVPGKYDLKTDRTTIFANVSWTMLILHLVVEGGWQGGGDRFAAPLPAGQSSRSEKSTYYGSFTTRLAL